MDRGHGDIALGCHRSAAPMPRRPRAPAPSLGGLGRHAASSSSGAQDARAAASRQGRRKLGEHLDGAGRRRPRRSSSPRRQRRLPGRARPDRAPRTSRSPPARICSHRARCSLGLGRAVEGEQPGQLGAGGELGRHLRARAGRGRAPVRGRHGHPHGRPAASRAVASQRTFRAASCRSPPASSAASAAAHAASACSQRRRGRAASGGPRRPGAGRPPPRGRPQLAHGRQRQDELVDHRLVRVRERREPRLAQPPPAPRPRALAGPAGRRCRRAPPRYRDPAQVGSASSWAIRQPRSQASAASPRWPSFDAAQPLAHAASTARSRRPRAVAIASARSADRPAGGAQPEHRRLGAAPVQVEDRVGRRHQALGGVEVLERPRDVHDRVVQGSAPPSRLWTGRPTPRRRRAGTRCSAVSSSATPPAGSRDPTSAAAPRRSGPRRRARGPSRCPRAAGRRPPRTRTASSQA